MSQPLVLQVFLFKNGQFIGNEMATGVRVEIGRDADCDIVLDDEKCSRKHAVIFEHDGQLALQDLGSANGTLINGEPVTGARVVGPRDDIGIGEFNIKLKAMSALRGPAQPPPTAMGQSTQLIDREAAVADAATAIAPNPMAPSQPSNPSGPSPLFEPQATEAMPGGSSSKPESLEELLFGGIEGEDDPEWDGDATVNLDPRATAEIVQEDVHATLEIDSPRDVTLGPIAALDAPTRVADMPDALAATAQVSLPSAPPPAAPSISGPAPVAMTDPAPPGLDIAPPMAAPTPQGLEAPSFGDGFVDDDEDDDDEPVEHIGWSLVQRVVREPSPDAANVELAALEVLHYRGEKILDHIALQPGESFKFGRHLHKDALKDRGLKRAMKLVTHKKRGVAEVRTHPAVEGKVLRQGQQLDLNSLAAKKSAPLNFGEMATLNVGGDTVYLRFTNEPSVVPTEAYLVQRREDLKLSGIATGVAVGVVLLMVAIGWILQYRALSQEIIQLGDEGFAEVYEKVEELELEKPEPEPEPMEEIVPEDTPKDQPKPDNTPPVPEKKVAKKPSALDALQNIPKVNDKASSQSMKAALSNIKAVKVPGASGYKLSALTGKGPTSGVQIGGAAGGVATSGLNSILRKTGGVGGLKGKKTGRVRGRVKTLRPRTRNDGGQLSRQEIQKVINQHISEIQYCYEKQLRTSPNLHGKVVVEWKIKRSGSVGVVKNKGSTLKSNAAIQCMMSKIKRWKFPKPRGNGGVIVKYPFIFNTI